MVVVLIVGVGFAQTLEDNWNDFLHYTKIGRLDLAKGYGQALLEGNPKPVELFALSQSNPEGYAFLLKVNESSSDAELTELTGKVLAIIEQGKFLHRSDPKIITEEIKRLSTTDRGRLAAVKYLQEAGEYAIPFMLDAMADNSRKEELPNIIAALPQIGKGAVKPLVVALQTEDVGINAEIIKALGQIGYSESLPYLKYVAEKNSSAELQGLAEKSIEQIDSAAAKVSAAVLFDKLGEGYYYHADSLAFAEDANFANIWFWNSSQRRLTREKVDKNYANELMTMRCCEWALKADPDYGQAISLWLTAYLKAESTGLAMPAYFDPNQPKAIVYATTAGPDYLHQALSRAIADKNSYVALGLVEALTTTAGEKSLFYRVATNQPLLQALSFDDKVVKYSAAIAIAQACPKDAFAESRQVATILAEALAEKDMANQWVTEGYAGRAAKAMLKLAQTRNTVIDLSAAQDALIKAVKTNTGEIRAIAIQILAAFSSPVAQRTVADAALAEDNPVDVRLAAFDALAASAKLNGNLLDDEKINAVYSLIDSEKTAPQLRSAAASAYGALNLPSQKVKNLILDQAKS